MAASARIDELKKRYEENQRRFFAPLANEYRKTGDLEQAIALCRMHLAEAPNNLSGQIVFAQALYDAGTLDESRAAFETAIGLDPENLIALRHLGDIARAHRDIPTARQWYQRVLDADRRNEEVLALMEELNTLELEPAPPPAEAAPDAPAAEADAPADAAPAPAMARSPVSSAASLTGSAPNLGSTTPTREIVGMARPKPAAAAPPEPPPAVEPVAPVDPDPAPAAEPARAATPEPAVPSDMGFDAPAAEPEVHTPQTAPDSSFGFDVDLDAAGQIPSYADESTSEFGVVELPVVSAFSDTESEPAPAPFEPVEMAYDATVEATLEGAVEPRSDLSLEREPDVTGATEPPPHAPAAEMPSVLEYVEPAPAPAARQEPNEELLDFELETPAPPQPVPEPAFEAFELTADASTPATEPAPADDDPAPARRASLESFDPIREMPTPIAPMAAARTQEAFATETMAELYVQQGLRQEAIGVYRQLVAARPDDANLRARLAELTGATRKPGGSTARAFFANLAGRRATPLRSNTVAEPSAPRTPTPMAQAVVEPEPEPVPEPAAEPSVALAEAAAAEPVEIADAPVVAASAGAATGAEPEPSPDTGASASATAAVEAEAPSETPSETPSEAPPGGTLDALFGNSGVATPENSAAQALAAAFASKPTPPSGRPTRAASDEFSLDRVFRQGNTPAKGGLSVPRQSTSLRFDQFFTPAADGQTDAPAANPDKDAGDDSEQFQSWLSRLKKP